MATFDMQALKEYVQAKDHLQYENLAPDSVSLLITHSNLQQKWPEIRVNLHTTVGELKNKLYQHGGTAASFQRLLLRSSCQTEIICELADDCKMLGFYGIKSGMNIHIVDMDPHSLSKNGGLEDVNLVQKYMMSDEEYAKRENSLRRFKEKMRESDPYWTFLKENRKEPSNKAEIYGPESVEKIIIGNRCKVEPGSRRGVVKWTGPGEKGILSPGYWVGVALDEPLGNNNGTIKGKTFFACNEKHGAFVRPDKVTVGDFPELDIEDLNEESSDDEYVIS